MNLNPLDLLKNAQKMQEQMESLQSQLGNVVVTGEVGGGMVEVDLNGRMECLAVRISDDVLNPPDKQMLQDLVAAAISSAAVKVREAVSREVGSAMGGLGLSGIPGIM
ncbi:nucleoid-associated protein [Spirochaetia bacterium]|nr:nucleoid-associated protein [Spirochaetia bacterium]